MSGGTWNLERVASAFATAATDPARWAHALEALASETGAVGAVVLPLKGKTPFVPFSESLQDGLDAYFQEGWYQRDARYRAMGRIIRDGVGVDYDYMTEEVMRTDVYYQEFLARFGLKYFAGVKIAAADDLWCIAIQRGPADGPFSDGEQTRLANLGERLSAAATLAQAIGFAHLSGMADGLEHVGVGAFFVGPAAGSCAPTRRHSARSGLTLLRAIPPCGSQSSG